MSINLAFAGFRHSHILGLYKSAMKNPLVNITGCCEEDKDAKKEAETINGIPFLYDSYEQVLNDASVDAIAIGDYYGKRGEMVISALQHGKHVICDKPICTSLEQLEKIEALVKETGLQVCCMFDLRYLPQVKKVKEIIESGELGEIHIMSFTGQHHLAYGSRPSWYFEEGKHGGTINDIAIHGIDLIKFITGKSLTKVNAAKVWNAFADKEPAFFDCGQLMVEMDGISVMADVSYAAPKCAGLPTYWDFYFWGSKGMLNFKCKDNLIHIYRDSEKIIECEEIEIDYLNDFIKEISGENTIMNTQGVLDTQRQVLTIQKHADNN